MHSCTEKDFGKAFLVAHRGGRGFQRLIEKCDSSDTLYVLIRVRWTYLQVGLENASSHEWQFSESRKHLRRYAAELS